MAAWENAPVVGDSKGQPAWMAAPTVEVAEERAPDGTLIVQMSDQGGAPAVPPASIQSPSRGPSAIASAGAGLGAGVGQVAMGAQRALGKGLDAVGLDSLGQWLVNDAEQGRARLQSELAPYKAENPMAAGGGEIVGNIASTLPVGGALAQLLKPVAAAAPAYINPLVAAIQSSGFRAGGLAGAKGLAARTAGGGVTGGVSAGLVDENNAGTGAAVGAILPGAAAGVVGGTSVLAKTVRNMIEPFSAAGQGRIADKVVRELAGDGPKAVNAGVLVPGSVPTLSQATGNPGVAALERGIRNDANLANPFIARDQANAAARSQAFDNIAGDAGTVEALKAARSAQSSGLYNSAFQSFDGQLSPEVAKEVGELLKRPSIKDAMKVAERWALERGEKLGAEGSLRGLHDVKGAIDDAIEGQIRAGANSEAAALLGTKERLLAVMDSMSPEYAAARAAYAEASKPINAAQTLQDLRLTDAQGRITLAKVQQALQGVHKRMAAPGTNKAKSLTTDQIEVLTAIRDDLLRESQVGVGRAIGSNTAQNLAMDRILSDALPFGNQLSQTALGGIAKRAGQLVYGGTDRPIREAIAERLLDPQLGAAALAPAAQNRLASLQAQAASMPLLTGASNALAQLAYRGAPLLSTGR